MAREHNTDNEIVILSKEVQIDRQTYPEGSVLFVIDIGHKFACKLVEDGSANFDVIE
jgi:hypothetical protein